MSCRVSVYLRIGIIILLIKDAFSEEDFDYSAPAEREDTEEGEKGFGNYNQKNDFPKDDTAFSDTNKNKTELINFDETEDDGFLKDCSVCGIINGYPNEEQSNTLHFDEKVEPHYRYPWIAWLLNIETKRKICGGAIIHKQWIILTAHCLESYGVQFRKGNVCKHRNGTIIPCNKEHSIYRVQLLTGKRNHFTNHRIEKVIPHPKFDRVISPFHDILLLKLKKPIQCNKFRLPICLPPDNYDMNATMEYSLPNWTARSEIPQLTAKDLGLTAFRITSPARCMSTVREKRPFRFHFEEYAFFHCMYGLRNKTVCHGDSGSVLFGPIGRKVYGVALFSARTGWICNPRTPIFFSSITGHLKWIQKHTGLVPGKGKVVVKGEKCTKKRTKGNNH